VPFDVKGGIEATPDGRIRMHAAAVRGFGLPVNPLMKLLGLEMDDLLKVKPGHGVTVEDNDLILDPQQLVPPPLIRGKVTAVRVADDAIVQTFGSGERQRLSPHAVSRNYIYWRGGELQFGKLTMTDTDLELVDGRATSTSRSTIGTTSSSRAIQEHSGWRPQSSYAGSQRPGPADHRQALSLLQPG
jgi:hypothetical protein